MSRASARARENSRLVRKYSYEAGFEYTTDNHNRLESRELQGTFRIEQQNSDLWVLTYARNYELIPSALHDLRRRPDSDRRLQLRHAQRQLHARPAAPHQRNRDGRNRGASTMATRQTVAYRGRAQMVAGLAVEPNVSLNWIDIPQGRFTNTVVGGRATYTVTPRMYVAALVQYSSSTTSLSTNIRFRWEYQPGSELFVVLHRGTGHPSSASHRSRDAWADGEDQPPVQVLSCTKTATEEHGFRHEGP